MRSHAVRAATAAPILVLVLFSAALPSSALAAAEIQAVTAPIGSTTPSAYTITIQNNGEATEGETLISFDGGAPQVSGVVPATCAFNQPVAGAIGCPALKSGQTIQVCWVGPAPTGVTFLSSPAPAVELATYPPIGVCPVAGFTPPSSGSSGTGSGDGSSTGGDSTTAKQLTLGKVAGNPKKGTATLTATVSAPGTLKLSGKGVKAATVKARAAGAVKVTVKAAGAAAKTLAKTGKVTLQAKVSFTPGGGLTTTLTQKVKLKKS
jgi:hypothetical protein